ncbi:MAG: MurR/RpiR family transcriptional regulator [Clostridia bacterium]|nr:MurR/RpiR family transcriptional regulator [Clostridia bacterium]
MTENVQEKIELYYASLSKGHKKIADYIKNNYERASFMTAAALGEAVGVSESTVVRFASCVGFSGFPEFKRNLQESVRSRLTSVQRVEAAGRMSGANLMELAFASDIEMIKKTAENISREAFAESVKAINRAKRIYIIGVRSSASLAGFAALYLSYLYDVVLIDPSSTVEMFEQMFRIDSDDVCIAISFPRYSSRTLKALKFAQSRQATIISITDTDISPIAPYATHLLLARSNMVSFVDSLAAPLSLINALVAVSAGEKQEELHKNLEELEEIWDEYHVYRVDGEK